jgi:hypothetical protein
MIYGELAFVPTNEMRYAGTLRAPGSDGSSTPGERSRCCGQAPG